MAMTDFLFTSESVTEGHPDKVADSEVNKKSVIAMEYSLLFVLFYAFIGSG